MYLVRGFAAFSFLWPPPVFPKVPFGHHPLRPFCETQPSPSPTCLVLPYGCNTTRLDSKVLNKVEDEEAEQAFKDDDPDSDDSEGRAM